MRALYTQGALSDLDDISYRTTVTRVERWPKSARTVTQWKKGNVRAVPLVRYPYVIFYQIKDEWIEVLHVRHASREPWKGPIG